MIPKSRPVSGLVILVGLALMVTPLLAGIIHFTIFDDLTGTHTGGGYLTGLYPGLGTVVGGPGFTIPTGQNYRLNQIQALLSFASGANDMTLRLYQDSGGVPGPLLESWHLVNVVPSAPSIVTVNSVKHPELLGGQRYWIALAMTDPTSASVWWINTLGEQGPSIGSWNGGPFTSGTTTSGFHAFAVTVTSGDGEDAP